MTNFERNINATADDISAKLREINEMIEELESRDSHVKERLAEMEPGSEEEQFQLAEHMRLMNVIDRHVRQVDYLNSLSELKETEEAIEEAKR